MIGSRFEFSNNWDNFEKLYEKLHTIHELGQKYGEIRKIEKIGEYGSLFEYCICGNDERSMYQMLAKAGNALIENYVRNDGKEES